jgi:hypothetical protein
MATRSVLTTGTGDDNDDNEQDQNDDDNRRNLHPAWYAGIGGLVRHLKISFLEFILQTTGRCRTGHDSLRAPES